MLFSLVRASESTHHGLLSGEWINRIFLSSNSPSWSYLHPTVLMGYMGCKSNAQLLVPEKKNKNDPMASGSATEANTRRKKKGKNDPKVYGPAVEVCNVTS